jgi:hypothetical protein
MELFRLFRSLAWEEPDKSGVIRRIVPNHSAFGKRNRLGLVRLMHSRTAFDAVANNSTTAVDRIEAP